MRDLVNNLGPITSIERQSGAIATFNGVGVDLQGFDSVMMVGSMSAVGTGTMKLQESDTFGSGYTDVAAAGVIGTQGLSLVASSAVKLGYIGNERYVRAVIITTVNADGIGAVAVKGNAATKKVV